MKREFAFAVASFLLAGCTPLPAATHEAIADWRSGRADPDCEIAGDSLRWQADYCFLEAQTDDPVAAQPCMDRESRTRHGEECARRRYFKGEWCRGVVANGSLPRSLAQCIADPEVGGAIVKGAHLE